MKDETSEPVVQESEKTANPNRRRLLTALAAGGVVGANTLPERWIKPVVDSVMLPAHAQATGIAPSAGAVSSIFASRESGDDSLLVRALEFVIPSAHARPPDSLYICVNPNATGTKANVQVWEVYGTCATQIHAANNVPVTNNWTPMNPPSQCSNGKFSLLDKLGIIQDAHAINGAEVRLESVSNGAKGELRGIYDPTEVPFNIPLGSCSAPSCCVP
jgi:hypothetical protein